ncbi:MAG: hypothetical protein A3G34_08590 [Candidatus Lindowbacteria bacterium RIFCSPLOWO2_12_FULL_62_27]|nr:MAG: hypothetical protein A3G34_08590 [Candidatus Lindowbacteria bacterium RIFCSPLOWO2_12_FULL_62_27]OGH62952.1 MAG: hypothetical protein A3I06_13840 [Candidatus Lindowbacteria bacterium RIFCSPLOWO2_02_FULL_62_12]
MNEQAKFWIERLGLAPHPEGGFYRETYASSEKIRAGCLPSRFAGDRVFSTAIYFLLEGRQVSKFHRIQSDELWHFYDGHPLTLHLIDPAGAHSEIKLGRTGDGSEQPQAVVPAGCWMGASLAVPTGFALAGCTVSPGFDFQDFEMASRADLVRTFPALRHVIDRLT